MATLKQRLHRKNSSGTYDTIHLETSADCITGTLGVAHGGTGKTNWTANRLLYASAATALAQLTPPGGSGYFLRQNASGAPYWSSPSQAFSALGALKHGVVTRVGTGEYQYFSYEIAFPVEPILWWTTYLDSNGVDGGMINYVVSGKPSGNVNMSTSSAWSANFSWSGNTLTVSTHRDNNTWWNNKGTTYCFHYLY